MGVLAALQARQTTGRGQNVDISMFDCQLSLLNYMATMFLMSGKEPGRNGNGHFVHVPYNTFRTKTRHIIVAIIADNGWRNLVGVLGDEALKRDEFATQSGRLANKDFIEQRVQAAFAKESCEYWLEKLASARVPAAPVNEISHAFADPQGLARNMKVRVPLIDGGSVEQPGNPVKLSDTFEDRYTAPPLLGQHTEAVLREFLDLGSEKIQSLRDRHVIEASAGLSEKTF